MQADAPLAMGMVLGFTQRDAQSSGLQLPRCPVAMGKKESSCLLGWLTLKGNPPKKSRKRKQPTGQLGASLFPRSSSREVGTRVPFFCSAFSRETLQSARPDWGLRLGAMSLKANIPLPFWLHIPGRLRSQGPSLALPKAR